MTSKPLTITSTRHATALTLYAVLTVLGLFHIVGLATHAAVSELVGEPGAALWSTFSTLGAGLALASATLAPYLRVPTIPLWGEAIGCGITSVVNAIYGISLTRTFGFDGGPTTQTLAYGLAVGTALRVIQIWREQNAIADARAHPHLANPPPLAKADTTGG